VNLPFHLWLKRFAFVLSSPFESPPVFPIIPNP
jgi:hypothetical protein